MGMFDYIVVHDNFVDNSVLVKGDKWQTKSLECHMHQYEITSEGRLLLNDAPFSKDGVSIDQEMHGEITFCTSVGVVRTPMWKWLEYTAKFTDGKLVDMTSNHQTHADQGMEVDKFCSKCGQTWSVHNDDGSCVDDKKGYCKECRVEHHDTCSMTIGCPCCENTMENL